MKIIGNYKLLFILSIIGIILSSYLLSLHNNISTNEEMTICDINDYVTCSAVSKSKFSEIYGIPVALLGIIGYTALAIISLIIINKIKIKYVNKNIFFILTSFALLFSLYLTYAEFFIIEKLCIYCLISQVNILFMFVLSYNDGGLK